MPVTYDTLPASANLVAFLTETGLYNSGWGLDTDAAINAAIDDFRLATGWPTLIASSTPTARWFTAPGPNAFGGRFFTSGGAAPGQVYGGALGNGGGGAFGGAHRLVIEDGLVDYPLSVTVDGYAYLLAGGSRLINTGNWAAETAYALNNVAIDNNLAWRCILAHTAAAGNEPGVGESWATDWVQLGDDYLMEDADALCEDDVFDRIYFVRPIWSQKQGITVIGRWGRWNALPASVWLALLERGAAKLMSKIQLRQSNGLVRLKVDGEEWQFAPSTGPSPIQSIAADWASDYKRVVRQYRRI